MVCVCACDHKIIFHLLKRKKMVISTTNWNACYIKHDTWYSRLIQTHVCGLQMHCFPFSWHQWGIQVYTWVAAVEKDSCLAAVQVSNGYLCKKLFFFFFLHLLNKIVLYRCSCEFHFLANCYMWTEQKWQIKPVFSLLPLSPEPFCSKN